MKKERIKDWIYHATRLGSDLYSFMEQIEFHLLKLKDQLDLLGRKCIYEVTSRNKKVFSALDKIEREALDIREPKDLLTEIDDLVGIRVVCYNLKDVRKIARFLKALPTIPLKLILLKSWDDYLRLSETYLKKGKKTLVYSIKNHENKIINPSKAGYRAYHLYLKFPVEIESYRYEETFTGEGICEVQVRTLAQGMWGTLSRRDFYKKHEADIPHALKAHMRLMSDQLYVTDQIADLIKKQIDQEKTKGSCRKHLPRKKIQDVLESLGFKNIKPLEIKTLMAALKIGNINTVSELKETYSDPEVRRMTKEIPEYISYTFPTVGVYSVSMNNAEVRPFVTQCVLGCIAKATKTRTFEEVSHLLSLAGENWPRYIRLLGIFW